MCCIFSSNPIDPDDSQSAHDEGLSSMQSLGNLITYIFFCIEPSKFSAKLKLGILLFIRRDDLLKNQFMYLKKKFSLSKPYRMDLKKKKNLRNLMGGTTNLARQ